MRHSPELNCQLFSSNFIKLGIQCDMRYELLRRPCHPRPRPWARSECQDRDQDITDQDQDIPRPRTRPQSYQCKHYRIKNRNENDKSIYMSCTFYHYDHLSVTLSLLPCHRHCHRHVHTKLNARPPLKSETKTKFRHPEAKTKINNSKSGLEWP